MPNVSDTKAVHDSKTATDTDATSSVNQTNNRAAPDYPREIGLTRVTLAFTFFVWAMVTWETFGILRERIVAGAFGATVEQLIFIAIVNLLIYGNFVYQFTRLGYYRRIAAHRPASRAELEAVYSGNCAPLTMLVPSYKEEFNVVRATLLSAALQDYPNRRVVLLIDDPHNPKDPKDQAALVAMRQLPLLLQGMFDIAAIKFNGALRDYRARHASGGIDLRTETSRVAHLYQEAAAWFERHAASYPIADAADTLLVGKVFGAWRTLHTGRAHELEQCARNGGVSEARLLQEYHRLAALFQVELSSFERKRYVNLSHEPNKAMNLNSYIALICKNWREVARQNGIHFEQTEDTQDSIRIADADFLLTLDADSIIVPDYALRLVHHMSLPGNERVAVAQTPYSAIPGATGTLERIAGATTDIQYIIHQGFTQHHATFWVGANALLRKPALDDIRTMTEERGYPVARYIQDRTVIEDTESSVDLVERGWTLYNYPERLAYSATPADFGSLLIQRRRWANGGLIILPKLVRYLLRGPVSAAKIAEGFFRVHYLGSIAVVNIGLLIALGFSFEHCIESYWLPLTALPYFFLYARDLALTGYRQTDLVRVYALNMLLIPINLGGVFKSIEQAITKRQIPFGRTPKVTGRTSAPASYILAEYAIVSLCVLGCIADAIYGRWNHALFALANAALLGYGIAKFIGFSASIEDVMLGLRVKPRRTTAALAQPARPSLPKALMNPWAPDWAFQNAGGQHSWLDNLIAHENARTPRFETSIRSSGMGAGTAEMTSASGYMPERRQHKRS